MVTLERADGIGEFIHWPTTPKPTDYLPHEHRREPRSKRLTDILVFSEPSEIVLEAAQDEIGDSVLAIGQVQTTQDCRRASLRKFPREGMKLLKGAARIQVEEVQKGGPGRIQILGGLGTSARHRVGGPPVCFSRRGDSYSQAPVAMNAPHVDGETDWPCARCSLRNRIEAALRASATGSFSSKRAS